MKFTKRPKKRKKRVGKEFARTMRDSFFSEYVKCNTDKEKDIVFKAYHISINP